MFRPARLPSTPSRFSATTSDVMATRSTGFGLMASGSVQEVMDMALIARRSPAFTDTVCPFL